MKKKIQIIVFTIFIFVMTVCQNAPAAVLQKLSGLAVSVNPIDKSLEVLFEHPVTGEGELKNFKILPSTNFKNVKRLDQIKPQDPVSVDYQSKDGNLHAVYIEVIPLNGVPFNQKEFQKKIGFFKR